MANRAKHRQAALVRRVEAGRMIKSDTTPQGALAYARVAASLGNEPDPAPTPEQEAIQKVRERLRKL